MALFKYFKKEEAMLPTVSMCQGSSLTKAQLGEANKAVMEVLNENRVTVKRGKYNRYTPEERASIGKYTAENGPSSAATHYSALLNFKVSNYS